MAVVPLFGLGQKGKSSTVTAQTHTNVYAELTPENEKSPFSFYGTPGLDLFYSLGETPIRGSITVGDLKYDVHRGVLYSITNAGVKTVLGMLASATGRVGMAYNGTQIAIVDGSGAYFYVYTIATMTFVTVSANVIGSPIDITFADGYGILTYADGKFQITSSYDFTTLDALEYATAESNPDGLKRGIADHGELILAGTETVEFWINNGNLDFPYGNQRGTTLEFGLAAPWSLVKYNDSLAGLFKNSMGQVQVMMLTGHALKKISSNELDYLINGYASVADATAYSYMLGGHPMLQINFTAQGKSWLYDAASNLWSSMEFGLNGERHRGEIEVDYLGRALVSDYLNGNVYTINPDSYTDNGTPIKREITTRHLSATGNRLVVHKLEVDFEDGVGLISGQGSDPQAILQFSKDNAHSWSNELWCSLGAIGEYLNRAIWRRLGIARDWTFRIRVTDPVKFVVTTAYMEVEPRK